MPPAAQATEQTTVPPPVRMPRNVGPVASEMISRVPTGVDAAAGSVATV